MGSQGEEAFMLLHVEYCGTHHRQLGDMQWLAINCANSSLSWTAYSSSAVCMFQSKKKGLSVDEKRTRMMEFFFEKVG